MSNAKQDKPVIDINPTIIALAEQVKKEFKLGEGGIITVEKDFFEKTLPENISMADVKRLQDHETNVFAAVGLATGEVGLAQFKKDKKLAQVSIDFNVGKNKAGFVFQRDREVSDGKGGKQVKHGILNAKVTHNGAGNRGAYKKVRDHLSALGASLGS